ncbi:MAG: acyl carrier protein [Nitrospinales bacterium]
MKDKSGIVKSETSNHAEEEIKQKVRDFIIQEFHIKDVGELTDAKILLGSGNHPGLFDSLGVLQLMSFLEKNFQLTLTDDDLQPENFSTLQTITALVSRKLNSL